MTDEADARARLLAYYEDRLILLAGKIAALAAETGTASPGRVLIVEKLETRFRREIADIRSKVQRLVMRSRADDCTSRRAYKKDRPA